MTITEFLLARIAEDEAKARAAASAPRPRGGWGSEGDLAGERWETRRGRGMLYAPTIENHADAALWDDEGGCDYMAPAPAVGAHIARHDPARVLAECEAKRAIVELSWHRLGDDDYGWGMEEAKRQILALMALPYADHPDYREEWRP